jgi:hypothetical protein
MRKTYSLLLIVIYVDDLLITGMSTSSISTVKNALHDRFSMTDLGLLHCFLGLKSARMIQESRCLSPIMPEIYLIDLR